MLGIVVVVVDLRIPKDIASCFQMIGAATSGVAVFTVGLTLAAHSFHPLPARSQDDLGVAVGRVRVNSKVTEGEVLYNAQVAPLLNLPPEPVQYAEYPMEIYYSLNITSAITLRPNIQFIHSPGGVDDRANVLVLGLHSSVKF